MRILKNTKYYSTVLLATFSVSLPCVVIAQTTFREFAGIIMVLLNNVTRLVMALALFAFIIGAIRFISTAGDDKSRESGKHLMIWGTVALFLMVAVWGIVGIIQTTFFGS